MEEDKSTACGNGGAALDTVQKKKTSVSDKLEVTRESKDSDISLDPRRKPEEDCSYSDEKKKDNAIKIKLLQMEQDKLKEKRLCQVCRHAEADNLCMPCGHIVVCMKCGKDASKCRKCDEDVTSSFKVYFA